MSEGFKQGGLRADKYFVNRTDGVEIPEAEYFVLRPDSDQHARAALAVYAMSVSVDNPEFADDIAQGLDRVREGGKFYGDAKGPQASQSAPTPEEIQAEIEAEKAAAIDEMGMFLAPEEELLTLLEGFRPVKVVIEDEDGKVAITLP